LRMSTRGRCVFATLILGQTPPLPPPNTSHTQVGGFPLTVSSFLPHLPGPIPASSQVDKAGLENLLARRMFVVPAFEIHGGVGGLFDYGPPGASLKEQVLTTWRNHFVLEDGMLQIECTTLTPYSVLKTSGHVDKFEDLMVKDTKNGECFRADKLLEDFIENLVKTDKTLSNERREELRKIAAQADAYEPEQLHAIFQSLGIKSPSSGSELTAPFPFNLMFQTSIGPTGALPGFLRPETAQGMFVNFRRLYDYNNGRMPMAVAQIGSAYRNEIAPRGGLIRVREFTMAEIEHFVHPERKNHPKFSSVAHVVLSLFPGDSQIGDGKTVQISIGEAVKKGMVNNETLGYFMARTALFMHKIGIKPEGLRFRQHLRTEMAHYACDCWDAEILMAQGWVECVGHADRSAYDLQVHSKATKVDLVAKEALAEPVEETGMVLKANKGLMGKTFKLDNPAVTAALEEVAKDAEKAAAMQAELTSKGSATVEAAGKTFTVTKEMLSFAS
jgi:glycyl-tRNA synthetase